MNGQMNYSDEHINAYIDGELDSDERAKLLFDEQNDAVLAERISNARMLKEKVQLAYSHIDESFFEGHGSSASSQSAWVTPMRAAAAVIVLVGAFLVSSLVGPGDDDLAGAKSLIASTDAIPSQQILASADSGDNIIIDLNRYDPANFDATISHIQKLAQSTSARVEVVANGQGLDALERSSKHATVLAGLSDQLGNLNVMVCGKSLAAAQSSRGISLLDNIVSATSVVHQVAKRSSQGWSYLKLQ